MKSLLLRQFRPTNAGTLHQQWLTLTQTGPVLEYQRAFIERLAPLSNIPDGIIVGQFLNGLNDEIRSEVQILSPMSVENAMTLAIKIEQKLQSQLKRKPQPSPVTQRTNTIRSISGTPLITPIKTTFYSSKGTTLPPIHTTMNQSVRNRVSGEVRRLTDKELQHKKERGLCYRCDENGIRGINAKRRS